MRNSLMNYSLKDILKLDYENSTIENNSTEEYATGCAKTSKTNKSRKTNKTKQGFLSQPEKLTLNINKNGVLKVKNKRYLRIGKISLHDTFKNRNITNVEYVGILDTHTGELLCFDIETVYNDYLTFGIDKVKTPDDRIYSISPHTQEIVRRHVEQDSESYGDFEVL
jgi:hypothetical protein